MDNPTNEISIDQFNSMFLAQEEEINEVVETSESAEELIQAINEVPEEKEEDNILENIEEKIIEVSDESDAYKYAKFLMSTGDLDDLVIEYEDKEIKLSEFKNIDEDTLKEIIASNKEEIKEQQEKDFIKVKGLTETQQKLINIVSKGNYEDLKEIFENPESLREPWEGYDPSNEAHNEQVYRAHLMHVQKLSPQQTEALLKIAKENLTLDIEAQEFVNLQREAFKKNLEVKSQELATKKKEEAEQSKQFTKDLTDKFKSMDLKPELVLSMVKTATQKNAGQKNTALEDIFYENMKDIQKASDLILFLTNKELYDSNIQNKAKLEERVDYVKKIKIVRDNKRNTTTSEQESNPTIDNVLKDVFNFNK